MMVEPHYPSKWSVAIVFFIILFLIIGVFAWAFYFNRGVLIFESADSFSVEFAGEEQFCELSTCRFSLAPGVYDFVAHREGYYDEVLSVPVERWQEQRYQVSFTLVPYLSELDDEVLPEPEPLPFQVNEDNGTIQFVRGSGEDETVLTTFETLNDPQISLGGSLAAVVDDGRLFFVDLQTGRKQRKFDDAVNVVSALLSSDGARSLLFVAIDQGQMLWVWNHETNEMTPLSWYEDPAFIQWEQGTDDSLFVVSDTLSATTDDSLFADLLQESELVEDQTALFRFQIQTGVISLIYVFEPERSPERLLLRDSRYFVEYDDASFQELVLQ